MKSNLICAICLAILSLAGMITSARAAEAPAPVGSWSGKFNDGSGGINLIAGANETASYQPYANGRRSTAAIFRD